MSRVYALTEKGKKIKELSGQQAVIFRALCEGSMTAGDIADAVGKKLETRQSPLRVVGFYLVRWKKAGLVRWVKAPGGTK